MVKHKKIGEKTVLKKPGNVQKKCPKKIREAMADLRTMTRVHGHSTLFSSSFIHFVPPVPCYITTLHKALPLRFNCIQADLDNNESAKAKYITIN